MLHSETTSEHLSDYGESMTFFSKKMPQPTFYALFIVCFWRQNNKHGTVASSSAINEPEQFLLMELAAGQSEQQ